MVLRRDDRRVNTMSTVTLFVCGDVMLGRGVDQILPWPGDPTLREAYLKDARAYVELAEAVPLPVDFSWPWGESLRVLDEAAPHVRVVNLETSVTRSDEFAPGKGVHYRMNPANLPCLAGARPDVCVLANNHVLDFGRRGLEETLDALADAALRVAGAGRDIAAARRPAVVPVGGGARVLVFGLGVASSGIPANWAATEKRSGVDFVPEVSDAVADDFVTRLRQKRPGDVAVASIHWGSNWGYRVPREQVRFAHRLIEGGFDVVHGHSSHHPRPIEVYRGKLVLYGCGDFIDDYEGITGHEEFRDDLRLLYFVTVDRDTGTLTGLRMVPMQARRMRLQAASRADTEWLRDLLDSLCAGAHIDLGSDGALVLHP
jgi:poly-gamma-glutamate capsule biosynthesis protein CapA/YwtB (metallophosphatase superfamily)